MEQINISNKNSNTIQIQNSSYDINLDENQNKNKIHSPPNEFILSNTYENSAETNYKKIGSDTSSLFSSSSDNDSSSVEIDSLMSSFRLKRVKKFLIFLNFRKKTIEKEPLKDPEALIIKRKNIQ